MNTKLSLIKRTICPPDGFRWVDPVDGWVDHAWDYDSWVQFAKNHLQANNRDVPAELAIEMENQLCKTLPPGWCNFDDPNRPRPSTGLGWGDVTKAVATFSRWIASGCRYVTQEESERRALICTKCYLNVTVEGCGACHKAVETIVKGVKTKYDFALKACAVCKCLLRAKVHFPIDTLEGEGTNQALYPDFCWLKKDGENYRG